MENYLGRLWTKAQLSEQLRKIAISLPSFIKKGSDYIVPDALVLLLKIANYQLEIIIVENV